MSVNAGEVYIDVGARLDQLDRGLTQAKDKAGAAGQKAGYDFGAKFSEQAKGIVGQLAGPMIAVSVAKGIASVLRSNEDMPTAILDAIKQVPFVGAFADLGSAIYDATFGAADKAAEDLIAKQQAARNSVLSGRGQARAEEVASETRAGGMVVEAERLRLQQELNAVKATGDERAIARAEEAYQIELQNLELRLRIANEDIPDAEMNALLKLNAERQKLLAQERDARLKAIEEREAKEREAAEKAAEEQAKREAERINSRKQTAEDELKRARILREEAGKTDQTNAEKRLRALQMEKELREAASEDERRAITERYRLEEETAQIKAQQAAAGQKAAFQAGSGATALGTFTFDPYPPATQRALDERMAKATEEVAQHIKQNGGFM